VLIVLSLVLLSSFIHDEKSRKELFCLRIHSVGLQITLQSDPSISYYNGCSRHTLFKETINMCFCPIKWIPTFWLALYFLVDPMINTSGVCNYPPQWFLKL